MTKYRNDKIMRRLICFETFLFVIVVGIQAQEPPVADTMSSDLSSTIEILSGSVSYDFPTKNILITASDEADSCVAIGSQTITAQWIYYESSAKILHATGAVRLWDEGNIMRGDRLDYDLNRKEGELRGLKSSELLENVYFGGDRLVMGHRAEDRPKDATAPLEIREYTLYDGTVTSNDLPVPFYHIKYDRLVFAPDKRASVYDAVFITQKWPLFYAPYFTKSLAEHEVTYFVNVDHYSKLGMAFMNRVMWRPNDEWVINLYGDYFTKAGIGKGAKVKMDIPGPYGPKATVYANHIKQEAPDNDNIYDGADRYDIALEYAEDLPYDMRVSAKGHQFSDSEYRWDYRGPEYAHDVDVDELERDSVSHLNLTKWWDDQSLRTTLATRLDNFYYSGLPYIERKPQVHFEQYPYSLFNSNFYVDLELDYGRYRREEGYTYPINKNTLYQKTSYRDEIDRYDANLRLSYPFHLPYQYTIEPWIGYRATYYADPMRSVGDPILSYEFDDENRLMFQGGVEFSRRSVFEISPFLDRYNRMRVVMEPEIAYAYYHPDTSLENITSGADVRFPYIDPVDEFRFKMHRLSAMLHSRIQGKTLEGISSDFMRFSAGVEFDYAPDGDIRYDNFEYYDDLANHDDYRFSDLVDDFNIYPYEWLTFGNAMRFDIDDSELRSNYTYTQIQPVDPLHVTLGYLIFKYPNLDAEEQHDLTLNVNWELSNKWQIYYTTWYDVDDDVFRRNHVGVVRDMYDFYGMFQVGYRRHPTLGDEFNFSVGLQFWGIGKKKTKVEPVLFY